MSPELRARLVALVVALVAATLATVLLFSPFLAEYDPEGAGPAHLRDAWRLTTESPLDGGQRVATFWAVVVLLATLTTLIGTWVGAQLDQHLPLAVAAVSSVVATVAGFAVSGGGEFGEAGSYVWTGVWGLSAWRCAHALVLVALFAYGYAVSEKRARGRLEGR